MINSALTEILVRNGTMATVFPLITNLIALFDEPLSSVRSNLLLLPDTSQNFALPLRVNCEHTSMINTYTSRSSSNDDADLPSLRLGVVS